MRAAPPKTILVERRIGAPDEQGDRVVRLHLGDAERDRSAVRAAGKGRVDPTEAVGRLARGHSRQRADELVTAVTNDQVEWTQVGRELDGHPKQQPVPSRVTATAVVDGLEPVDIHERKHQQFVGIPGSDDRVVQERVAGTSPIHPGQAVEGGKIPFSGGLSTIGQRSLTIRHSLRPPGGPLPAISRGDIAVDAGGPTLSLARSAVRQGSLAVALSQGAVAGSFAAISQGGRPVCLGAAAFARPAAAISQRSLAVRLCAGALARTGAAIGERSIAVELSQESTACEELPIGQSSVAVKQGGRPPGCAGVTITRSAATVSGRCLPCHRGDAEKLGRGACCAGQLRPLSGPVPTSGGLVPQDPILVLLLGILAEPVRGRIPQVCGDVPPFTRAVPLISSLVAPVTGQVAIVSRDVPLVSSQVSLAGHLVPVITGHVAVHTILVTTDPGSIAPVTCLVALVARPVPFVPGLITLPSGPVAKLASMIPLVPGEVAAAPGVVPSVARLVTPVPRLIPAIPGPLPTIACAHRPGRGSNSRALVVLAVAVVRHCRHARTASMASAGSVSGLPRVL